MKTKTPKVEMPCTMVMHSDRHACTVVKVSPTKAKIVVQRDIAIRKDKNGVSENQEYSFERDPNGPTYEAFRNKKGQYQIKGKGAYIALGFRDEYFDPCFLPPKTFKILEDTVSLIYDNTQYGVTSIIQVNDKYSYPLWKEEPTLSRIILAWKELTNKVISDEQIQILANEYKDLPA